MPINSLYLLDFDFDNVYLFNETIFGGKRFFTLETVFLSQVSGTL